MSDDSPEVFTPVSASVGADSLQVRRQLGLAYQGHVQMDAADLWENLCIAFGITTGKVEDLKAVFDGLYKRARDQQAQSQAAIVASQNSFSAWVNDLKNSTALNIQEQLSAIQQSNANAAALVQQETQRAEGVEASLVNGSSVNGVPYTTDWAVTNIGINKTLSSPWFDAPSGPGYVFLATKSDLDAAKGSLSVGSRLVNRQVFSSGGSYTYTPTAGASHIVVKLCGAGGGGGGVQAGGPGFIALAFGGTGGTYAETPLIQVPSTPINIVVGSGGAGGIGYNYGGNGGVSSFGTVVTCPGGPGGARGWSIGAGGQLANSSWAYSNAPSGNFLFCAQGSGPSDVMVVGGLAALLGSRGGGSFFGDGSLADSSGGGQWLGNNLFVAQSAGSGSNAFITGTGGGGAISNGGGAYNGGNGADGIVIVEEYS